MPGSMMLVLVQAEANERCHGRAPCLSFSLPSPEVLQLHDCGAGPFSIPGDAVANTTFKEIIVE